MNYSEFLKMIPEAFLVLALIVVFFGDFCLHKSEKKNAVLSKLTGVLLLAQIFVCLLAEEEYAFGGLYFASSAVNVMKTILTFSIGFIFSASSLLSSSPSPHTFTSAHSGRRATISL